MNLTNSINDIYNWYSDPMKTVTLKDRLMIHGAGLLWIPLYWLLFIGCIVLGSESYSKFTLYTLISSGIGFLVFGLIFSFVEIYKISIWHRYEQYFKNCLKDIADKQKNDFSEMIETDAKELFNAIAKQADAEPFHTFAKPTYGGCQKEVMSLKSAMQRFSDKYFPKN